METKNYELFGVTDIELTQTRKYDGDGNPDNRINVCIKTGDGEVYLRLYIDQSTPVVQIAMKGV